MHDSNDLIDRICAFAAMIMEDTHEIAVVSDLSQTTAARTACIAAAGADIVALAAAAAVIAKRAAELRNVPNPP